MGHVYISAAHKSSGKTMIATGLARGFADLNITVQPFKKGPDYIDPKWLGEAAGRACLNLDFNTQTLPEMKELFANTSPDAALKLIEGNKGLYDGTDVLGSNSNAALAKLLNAPVILVVDTTGITRGVAPLLMGYQVFDPSVNIAGVILNKVLGARHEQKLINAIEHYTDISVLGAVGRSPELSVDERHLGLIPNNEHPTARKHIEQVASQVTEHVDMDRVLDIANSANPVPLHDVPQHPIHVRGTPDLTIAVAKDAAFGFYYADDLAALEQAGVQLAFFDALVDTALPPCDGLFLGGGFPETQMDALAENTSMRASIKAAIESGLPAYAECGGLMYLCRSIEWNGHERDMVGVISADAKLHARAQGRGYVHLTPTSDHPWPGAVGYEGDYIPAHEFHHSSLENLDPNLTYAFNVTRGHGINGTHDGIVMHNLVAGYAHLRDTSQCRWVEPFVQFVRQTKTDKGTST